MKKQSNTSSKLFKNFLYFAPRSEYIQNVKSKGWKPFKGLKFQKWLKTPRKVTEIEKRSMYLLSDYYTRNFFRTWLAGITRTLQAVRRTDDQEVIGPERTFAKVKNADIIMKSRGDLSGVRTKDEIKLAERAEGSFGNKGFYGTPLPLIPDIRSSEVVDGVFGKLLEAFGVKRKFDRNVILKRGPNKKANRYLTFQYKRLIKTLEGQVVPGTSLVPAHVCWKYDFYKISVNAPGGVLPDGVKKWVKLSDHLKDKETKQPSRRKLFKKTRHLSRVYWSIANQLIRSSVAFRMAVMKKSMGKTGRWFHRHFDLKELFKINLEYNKIADTFDHKIGWKYKDVE